MLKHRLIFGLLFIAILAGIFYFDTCLGLPWPEPGWIAPPGAIVALATLALIPQALREMRGLLARQNVTISMRICVLASILCVLWPWLNHVAEALRTLPHPPAPWSSIGRIFYTQRPAYVVPTVMAAALLASLVHFTRHHRIAGAMANAGATLLAIVYLGVLPGFFLAICLMQGAWMLVGIIAIVKAADIGAYSTGRLIGRHKLIPWLSPGKTVEGFFGGLALAAVAGTVVAVLKSWPPLAGILGGIVLGAVGQVGDLLESLLKRDAGVKDSGHVPGFGGLLDLADSPLLAAPAAYWLLKLAGHLT